MGDVQHKKRQAGGQELSVRAMAERLRGTGVLDDSIGKQMKEEMDEVKEVVSEEHKDGLKERLKRNKEDLFLFSAILDPKWREL